uniref:C-C motif chemokine n=1 Tax=Stegastes partitus TaxID=144197 RepID=A0A3B4ZV95_9TELE
LTFRYIYLKYFFRHSDGSSLIVLSFVSRDPQGCCFGHTTSRLNKKHIDSYYITHPRCAMSAVVLITKGYRHICANPSLRWVKDIMNYLDDKSST